MISEQLVRHSDNQIRLILTEDGDPITGAWTSIEIFLGGISILRTQNEDGITLSTTTGLFTLNPADLTAPEVLLLDTLTAGVGYRVQIVIKSAINDDGAVFGGEGSDSIFFFISDKPE